MSAVEFIWRYPEKFWLGLPWEGRVVACMFCFLILFGLIDILRMVIKQLRRNGTDVQVEIIEEGRRARRKGLKASDNPYIGRRGYPDEPDAEWWEFGFFSISDPAWAPKKPRELIIEEGRQARLAGAGFSDNPYANDSRCVFLPEADWWSVGFLGLPSMDELNKKA